MAEAHEVLATCNGVVFARRDDDLYPAFRREIGR